ncbi:MAG: DUF4105 domain-containing protein, partial [Gammaproteobacteria bacterium]|nr:DUF4105 domain-containing protein [Gammaproteobacteria bacterium]
MYRPWLILVCLCPCLLPYPSAWAADQAYLQQLTREAGQRQLQAAPEWRALLHYKADLLGGGYTSEAVTPGFFLAAGGRTHPGAELRATLASFFAAPAPGDPDAGSQCRFIARYRWLKQELHFDPARLPQTPCPHFDAWYRAIDPDRLVLIFPAAYVNNPSSMFGHTFLRFDHPRQPRNTHLESYAVNFAAQTRESNGLIFAIKGLTGLYPGEYSLEPYYKAVNAYSDIENRDIWEYQLDYSPAEIRRILEHVWELRDVAFRYYFFNRNCSYAVLALLDVARPQLRLTHRFVYQVIPSNTVKAVLAQQGVLLETTYRPSLLARTRYRLQHMDPHDRRLALDVATRQLPPDASAITALAPERQALIYESAADYLLYQGNRGQLPKRDYGPLTLAILRARSRVQSHEVLPSMPIPDTDPVLGHGSSRSSLDVGRLAGEDYREIELRAAYHDLLDPPAGFVDGAQIDMFALALRDSGPRHNTRL